MTPLRQRMLHDMEIRNLADNTQKSYLIQVRSFARHFHRSPEVLGPDEIRGWLVYLLEERKLAPASLGATIGALRFLYRVTLKRDWSDEDFPLPRKPFGLPVVLSLEEITTFFESIARLKHRTILMTAYAAGLRVSEVMHLKVTDIDSKRMVTGGSPTATVPTGSPPAGSCSVSRLPPLARPSPEKTTVTATSDSPAGHCATAPYVARDTCSASKTCPVAFHEPRQVPPMRASCHRTCFRTRSPFLTRLTRLHSCLRSAGAPAYSRTAGNFPVHPPIPASFTRDASHSRRKSLCDRPCTTSQIAAAVIQCP